MFSPGHKIGHMLSPGPNTSRSSFDPNHLMIFYGSKHKMVSLVSYGKYQKRVFYVRQSPGIFNKVGHPFHVQPCVIHGFDISDFTYMI